MKLLLNILILAAFFVLEYLIGGTRLLYALPGIQLVALCGVLIFFVRDANTRGVNAICLSSAVLFVAYVLIRNRLSPVDYIARLQFFTAGGCLVLYMVWVLVVETPKQRKIFYLAMMVLALVQILVGLVQFKNGGRWMFQSWAVRGDDWWRASGFYISPNHFAGFLELIALMGLSLAVWGRFRLFGRVLLLYLVLCCLAGIAITGSRGGYVSISFGLIMFLILSLAVCWRLFRERFWVLAVFATVVLFVMFAGAVVVMSNSDAIQSRLSTINDTENMRFLLWHAAFEQFKLAPVFGAGGFTYLYFGRLFRDPSVQNDPIHVHNDYVQLLAEYGAIAAILFAVFLVVHLVNGGRSLFQLLRRAEGEGGGHSDRLALCIGALCGVSAYMVHSVVDFNMHIPANALMMATLLGILASPTAPASVEARPPWDMVRQKVLRWGLPAFSLILLLYSLPMLPGEWYANKARRALQKKELEKAQEAAITGLRYESKNPDLYYFAGEASRAMALEESLKKIAPEDHGISYFLSGLKVFPYDSRLMFKLAHAQSDAKQYYPALATLQHAEEWDPNSAYLYAYRGLVDHQAGRIEEARGEYESALELDPGNTIAQEGFKITEEAVKKLESHIMVEDIGEVVVPEEGAETPELDNNEKPQPTPKIELDIRKM